MSMDEDLVKFMFNLQVKHEVDERIDMNGVCKRCKSTSHESKRCPNRTLKSLYRPPAFTDSQIFDKLEIKSDFSRYLHPEDYKVTKMRAEVTEVDFTPLESFRKADLHKIVLNNIVNKLRYKYPTNIQKVCIPIINMGRDVLARALTGSGKTVAIMAPIISGLLRAGTTNNRANSATPRCVVLSPTRELCNQLHMNVLALTKDTALRTVCAYGGCDTANSRRELSSDCDIVISTPARLRHFVSEGIIVLSKCKYFIVDEADIIIKSMKPDFDSIVSKLPPSCEEITDPNDPSRKIFSFLQTVMFSATFLNFDMGVFNKYLRKYNYVNVGLVNNASTTITQKVVKVPSADKLTTIVDLINSFREICIDFKAMVFVGKIVTCDSLFEYLNTKFNDITIANMHSADYQENREDILNKFKNSDINLLICTDLASRGLDISEVEYIVQYDMANTIESYVHRIGRAGRCGQSAKAVTFFDPSEDNFNIRTYHNTISDKVETVRNKQSMSRLLTGIMSSCDQEIPEWLEDLVTSKQTKNFLRNSHNRY